MSLIATKKPRFSPKIQREFFDTLNARVKDHFEDNQKSRFANLNMVLKTFFMLALYFAPFVLLLCGLFTSPLMVFVVYILMALAIVFFILPLVVFTIESGKKHGNFW